MKDLSSRLNQALGMGGIPKRELVRKLQKAGVSGASYPSLQAYLRDERPPPVDFLVEFSRLCQVRSAWLIAGEGAPTAEEEVQRIWAGRTGLIGLQKQWQAEVVKTFPEFLNLYPNEQSLVYAAWSAWKEVAFRPDLVRDKDRPGIDSPTKEDELALLRKLGQIFRFPLEELPAGSLSAPRLQLYVILTAGALMALVPEEVRARDFLTAPPVLPSE